ncbi:MAG: hypothetical protein LBQ39_06380 [Tannerellaceae bacterium]|jgi:hypothetical protein|nr:hypothetical protein [Tannerellaceae bacterium]
MKGRKSGNGKLYRINTLGTYIYTLGLSLLCWVAGYIYSVGFPVYGGVSAPPLWNIICRILPGKTITYLVAFFLTLGGAFLIHRANYAVMIIRDKTLLPFLLYILLISTNPDFFPLKSTSVGVFCLILAMYQLFASYHDSTAKDKAFNAALCIGIGSLIWVHILCFLPLFWIGMYNFKTLSIRTFVASLFGVGAVYWFLLGWCVWQQDYTPFTIPFSTFLKFRFFITIETVFIHWMHILFVGVLVFIAILYILTHQHEEGLRTRQFLSFLIMFALFSFALYFLYEQSSEEFLSTACLPVAILLAHFFTVNHGKKIFWFYHFSILFFVLLLALRLWISLSNMVI